VVDPSGFGVGVGDVDPPTVAQPEAEAESAVVDVGDDAAGAVEDAEVVVVAVGDDLVADGE
jgi:hypothetical protein